RSSRPSSTRADPKSPRALPSCRVCGLGLTFDSCYHLAVHVSIPVGTRHTATTGSAVRARFRCARCGYERNIVAVGFGRADQLDLFSLDPAKASHRAASGAAAKAERAAWRSIAVTRC